MFLPPVCKEMMSVVFFGICLLALLSHCMSQKQRAALGPYHMNRQMYQCIKDFIKGEFHVRNGLSFIPISTCAGIDIRVNTQLKMSKFCMKEEPYLWMKQEKSTEERDEEKAKGTGAKRMYYRLKGIYLGMSERSLQILMERSMNHQLFFNKRFINKPSPRTVTARSPQERHQIDLMDNGEKYVCKSDTITYRYILTVLDVFSRYMWPEALPDKASHSICKKLKNIYEHYGQLQII